MYHELTDEIVKQKKKRTTVLAVIIIALLIAAYLIVGAIQENSKLQGAVALQQSILSSAKQACAIEGSYPSNLGHLERNYGLVINHDDYLVSYECFAGNVMPSVVVTPR